MRDRLSRFDQRFKHLQGNRAAIEHQAVADRIEHLQQANNRLEWIKTGFGVVLELREWRSLNIYSQHRAAGARIAAYPFGFLQQPRHRFQRLARIGDVPHLGGQPFQDHRRRRRPVGGLAL